MSISEFAAQVVVFVPTAVVIVVGVRLIRRWVSAFKTGVTRAVDLGGAVVVAAFVVGRLLVHAFRRSTLSLHDVAEVAGLGRAGRDALALLGSGLTVLALMAVVAMWATLPRCLSARRRAHSREA